MINPETIKLPVWVIGVGLVHAAAIALVLPTLITLPAPSGTERKVEVLDVELVPAAQLEPKIELDVDQTAALSSFPEPQTEAAETAAPEPVAESPQAAQEPTATKSAEATSQAPDESAIFPAAAAPDPVANVEPEATPATTPEPQGAPTIGSLESEPAAAPLEQAEPKSKVPAPKPAAVKKPKTGKAKAEGNGTKTKAAKPASKKPAVAMAKPKPKPMYRRTSQDVARKGLSPFKGSWSQLLGGPTPVPAKR